MWTNIAKPSADNWVRHNPQGKEEYDESDIMYDDPNVFYDSTDMNMWTDVAKPTSLLTWNLANFPWNSAQGTWGSPTWTPIPKPV